MQRRIITLLLALAAFAPVPAAHAAGPGQDPLLSGYGSPGTGEQVVLPAPAAGTSRAAKAAGKTLDPAITESPAALAVPGSQSGSGGSTGRSGAGSGKTRAPELTSRPVAERRAIVAAATAGRTESPLFDTSDLSILAVALIALGGFALTARSHRRHG